MILALANCTNPYDPGQRAVGGSLLHASAGAAIGGIPGGVHGAAIGGSADGVLGANHRRHDDTSVASQSIRTVFALSEQPRGQSLG